MQVVVWIALAAVVGFVAVDMLVAFARRPRPPREPHDPTIISTQKIIVDLTKRR